MAEDITQESIKKTQKILGKHIKKPALTEKLLKKPPFRFLHDIVVSVIKDTGFLNGLFTAEELKSENIKEKEAKIAFLNKLIDAIKAVSKADLTVRASKVVAGLEPSNTNLLLQAIGKSIDEKVDATNYIAQLNSGQISADEKKKLKKAAPAKDEKVKVNKTKTKDDSNIKATKSKKTNELQKSTSNKTNTQKTSSRGKNKEDKPSKIESERKSTVDEVKTENKVITDVMTPKEVVTTDSIVDNNKELELPNSHTIDDHVHDQIYNKDNGVFIKHLPKDVDGTITINNANKDASNDISDTNEVKTNISSTIVRPKSARSKNRDGSASHARKTTADQEESLEPLQITANLPQRPKSSLRPPSVRPSSARPGAPRLRPDSALPLQDNVVMGNINVIVENVDNIEDEETVVIQTTSEVVEDNFSPVVVPQDNKGQLVEQILEQIQEEDDGAKKKVDIDWEKDALHSKDGAAKETDQLRSLIQTLTKTANPLGKLLNYLHEDIDAMHGELQMWTNIKNQLLADISKQKKFSIESNKPLMTQLEYLQEDIRKQQQEIITVRSSILRNELRIKELLNV